MIMRNFVFVVGSLIFVSCATTVGPKTSGPNAPRDGAKTGSVAYNPDGLKDIVDARRESALRRIVEQCGSNNYVIVKEEKREKTPDSDSVATFGTDVLHYIDFECKD